MYSVCCEYCMLGFLKILLIKIVFVNNFNLPRDMDANELIRKLAKIGHIYTWVFINAYFPYFNK